MRTPEEQANFDYQLLGRLQMDCKYYLGNGGRAKKHLWAQDEVEQIQKMKELYAGLPVKPEWITLEEIEQYEAAMTRKTIYCLAYVDRAGDGVDQYDCAEDRAKALGKTGENEITFEVTVALNADAESIEDAIDVEFVKHRSTPQATA